MLHIQPQNSTYICTRHQATARLNELQQTPLANGQMGLKFGSLLTQQFYPYWLCRKQPVHLNFTKNRAKEVVIGAALQIWFISISSSCGTIPAWQSCSSTSPVPVISVLFALHGNHTKPFTSSYLSVPWLPIVSIIPAVTRHSVSSHVIPWQKQKQNKNSPSIPKFIDKTLRWFFYWFKQQKETKKRRNGWEV